MMDSPLKYRAVVLKMREMYDEGETLTMKYTIPTEEVGGWLTAD